MTSKILKVKNSLTLEEAAAHVSTIFQEPISERDIIELVLDRKLTLSINIRTRIHAKRSYEISPNDPEWKSIEFITPYYDRLQNPKGLRTGGDLIGQFISKDRFIYVSEEIESIDGIWDLSLHGAEKGLLEELLFQAAGTEAEAQHERIPSEGIIVHREGSGYFQLQEHTIYANSYLSGSAEAKSRAIERYKKRIEKNGKDPKYFPLFTLPKTSLFLVKTPAMNEFVTSLFPDQKTSTRSKEIASLQKMILGMAMSKYKFDPDSNRNNATGSNYGSIVADLQKVGLSLEADTIRKYLTEAKEHLPPKIPMKNT